MANAMAEVLCILPQAEEQGVISKAEKAKIKELLYDEGNMIVEDILAEYLNTHNQAELLKQFKSYIQDCESDGEGEKLDIGGSPEDGVLAQIKKKKMKSVKHVAEQVNIAECEEGLSPKVIFNKK
jgi:hypothetical protein